MARRFRLLLGWAMAVRCRFAPALYPAALTLARGWGTILRAHLSAADFPVFPRSVTAKEIGPPLVAQAFAAGSFPATDCPSSPVADLFRFRIGLAAVAVRLFAAADLDPDPAVVAGLVFADLAAVAVVAVADSGCLACPSAVVTGKGRVVVPVPFCF